MASKHIERFIIRGRIKLVNNGVLCVQAKGVKYGLDKRFCGKDLSTLAEGMIVYFMPVRCDVFFKNPTPFQFYCVNMEFKRFRLKVLGNRNYVNKPCQTTINIPPFTATQNGITQFTYYTVNDLTELCLLKTTNLLSGWTIIHGKNMQYCATPLNPVELVPCFSFDKFEKKVIWK